MKLSQNAGISGTSLIEATIAACTSAIFLGSLFSLNMVGLKTIRTAREASSASQVLQQRIESMRIANWHQVTDVNWLIGSLLNSDAAGADGLKAMKETLTLEPYGSSTVGSTQIERIGGATTIVTPRVDRPALLQESAMKVIWTVKYSGGINGKDTTRQTVAILAQGGVARW